MSTALLIIDVQQILCKGPCAVADIKGVLTRINHLSADARDAGVPVILVQHEEDEGPMQVDAEGWQLAQDLEVRHDDLKIRKTTPDSFHKTELNLQLQSRDITRLVICGMQSDFCVDTTVRRALSLGFEVVLVADAHSTLDNSVLTARQIINHHNATLAHFGPKISVIKTAEVVFEH